MATRNEYAREYNLKRYHRLRSEAINSLGGKCKNCESTEFLELDHIDPKTKTMEVAKMLNSAKTVFWEEVAKCQILCKECHKLKSIEERGFKIAKGTHGTLSSYRYCKCELCKEAKHQYYLRTKHSRKKRNKATVV